MSEQLQLPFDDDRQLCRTYSSEPDLKPSFEALVQALNSRDYSAVVRALKRLETYAWKTFFEPLPY